MYTYAVWCVLNAGESIGILFCACIYHVGFGVTIMSVRSSVSSLLPSLMPSQRGTPCLQIRRWPPLPPPPLPGEHLLLNAGRPQPCHVRAQTFLSFWSVMSGFFSIKMPQFLIVINHASILKYLGNVLAVIEFTGLVFTCEANQRLPNGQCPVPTGEAVLDLYEFSRANLHRDLGILGLLAVLYRLIAYAVLDGLKHRHFK